MSAEQMILTVLATKLAQAVAADNDNPDGHDIASGLYGPAVSEWLREVAKELAPAEPVVLECKAGDLKALMRSHYERRPRAIAEQAEPVAQKSAEWERRFLAYAPSSDPAEAECDIPPHGWRCTRTRGHDGPCAAVAAHDDTALVRRSMARLAAAEQAEPVVWECKAGGLKPLTQSQYDRQSDAIKRHYSRIETPAPLAADLPPNEELLALAERIDHDELWSRSVMERQGWTPEQRDRCDAGVHLRRYASLLGQDRWRIFPPKEGLSFSAKTLDGAIRMARNYEERHRG